MQYVTEDTSPVKKKVTVTVPAEEGEAALATTIATYRTSITLDGFRKGKVPANIIEKRFHQEVYNEATTDLVNVHINEIMSQNDFSPVSRIDYAGGNLERGKDFVYTISFEVSPTFDLPEYEGFEVEQEETEVDEGAINAIIDRLRSNMAEEIAIGEERQPRDGDIAILDFEAVDENGQAIGGIRADNFQLSLGEGQTLADFENLIKNMRVGDEGDGPVTFPQDFFNPEFAGRTVTMKVKLHAIKERRLPELDDAFAQKAGGFENMEKLRDNVRRSYTKSREDLNKSAAQNSLLESLLKLVDFPVPDSMCENHASLLVNERRNRLERQGKSFSSIGTTEAAVREEVKGEAEKNARAHIFLLEVARKADLSVTEQEVDLQLRRMALQSGQEYNAIKEHYTRHNLLFALRDRLLADKGMEAIYEKVVVKLVPPHKVEKTEETGKTEEKKTENKAAAKAVATAKESG